MTGALWQQAVVLAVVLPCAAYTAWTLVPAAWRRPVARLLLRHRWLAGSATLTAAARPPASGSCACTGCDQAAPKSGAGTKVVRIVPRVRTTR